MLFDIHGLKKKKKNTVKLKRSLNRVECKYIWKCQSYKDADGKEERNDGNENQIDVNIVMLMIN